MTAYAGAQALYSERREGKAYRTGQVEGPLDYSNQREMPADVREPEREIIRALDLTREFNLRAILARR